MKRVCCLLLALSSVLAFSGCIGQNFSSDNDEGLKLTYNKKYVHNGYLDKIESRQKYYIFYEDGTAKYHYYYNGGDLVEAYTIYFKYEIVEEENMVFCFYNGMDYDEADTEHDGVVETTIHKLMYTENFVMDLNGIIYMTEDFARDIPNFG